MDDEKEAITYEHLPPSQQSAQGPVPKPGEPVAGSALLPVRAVPQKAKKSLAEPQEEPKPALQELPNERHAPRAERHGKK